jgi:hypothetical protein
MRLTDIGTVSYTEFYYNLIYYELEKETLEFINSAGQICLQDVLNMLQQPICVSEDVYEAKRDSFQLRLLTTLIRLIGSKI